MRVLNLRGFLGAVCKTVKVSGFDSPTHFQNEPKKFEVSKEELEKLVSQYPMTTIGKMFGVSDNAIRKRCKKLDVDFKKKKI